MKDIKNIEDKVRSENAFSIQKVECWHKIWAWIWRCYPNLLLIFM